uniref:Uncharacterized protein n=1 Tax=Sinocyclocheilus rhinocerous TaxID=307959 RepID=A0A673JVZ7_9TELE
MNWLRNMWKKVLFSDEKKINLDGPDGFQRAFSFNGIMELQVVQGHQTAAGYVDMLQRASLLTEGPRLCGQRSSQCPPDFFQDYNVTLLDHPACSPDLFLGLPLDFFCPITLRIF